MNDEQFIRCDKTLAARARALDESQRRGNTVVTAAMVARLEYLESLQPKDK